MICMCYEYLYPLISHFLTYNTSRPHRITFVLFTFFATPGFNFDKLSHRSPSQIKISPVIKFAFFKVSKGKISLSLSCFSTITLT
uniref:Uncharacterized protein n=1 Tax=Populus trichocarpa TaxID=3694 RepID=U5GBV9_POPTR